MSFIVHQGDALSILRTMPEESVHCCVTSPPYFALRDYSIEPSVWGGKSGCIHRWGEWAESHDVREETQHGKTRTTDRFYGDETRRFDGNHQKHSAGQYCRKCGAWRGALGLEPSPELFIAHIVEVFREVRRVLHSAGSLWLNLGDSYQGSGLTGGDASQPGTLVHRPQEAGRIQAGLKPKDLLMLPARVAIALQADGWYLRQQIVWLKRNCMPESCADRPPSALEYIYLLSKSEDYYYDREAVRIAASGTAHSRGQGVNPKAMGPNSRMMKDQDPQHQTESKIRAKQNRSFSAAVRQLVPTRARRNSDWFLESFKGLLPDENGDPLAMLVNPQPFAIEMCRKCEAIYAQREFRKLPQREDKARICACGESAWLSHFATFAEALVRPCILAATSERGHCPHCGAPMKRIVEKPGLGDWHPDPAHKHDAGAVNGTAKWAKESPQSSGARAIANVARARAAGNEHDNPFPAPVTLGWEPTCSHPLFPAEPTPAVVLDPFSGSGRTGLAAVKLGRDYVGIEANPSYVKISLWQHEQWKQAQEAKTIEAAV